METFCAVTSAIFVGALLVGLVCAHVRISDLQSQCDSDRDRSRRYFEVIEKMRKARRATK